MQKQRTILKCEEEEEEQQDVRFMKPEFFENMPQSAKEYDEKKMYDRDGTLSQDFLRVSYIDGSETIFEIGVTLILLGLFGLHQNGQFTENSDSSQKLYGKNKCKAYPESC